jgi:hypothetical protein
MGYADTLKALLAKKNEKNNQGTKRSDPNTPHATVKDQVASHKPGKKSAGRGR